jgi:hypothetical protein
MNLKYEGIHPFYTSGRGVAEIKLIILFDLLWIWINVLGDNNANEDVP